MEPLTPNDPIWKLLGKTRPVEPRGNFTQNVMRAVRSEPQEKGWMFALRDWLTGWQRPALVGAAACAAMVLAGVVWLLQPENFNHPVMASTTPVVAPVSQIDADLAIIADDMSMPLDGVDHLDALVALDDTSVLTDKEIAFLLY